MSKKPISRKTKISRRKPARTKDSEIDTSDIPALDKDFFRKAEIRMPKPKQMVSIRLDEDVLAWFKKQGKGYQTKINEILKMYMRAKAA
jgi:uncharacterized protein (DUF4415 family)